MSAAGAGRCSEGLDRGEWAHSRGFSCFSFSLSFLSFWRRPTRQLSVPVPASPCFCLAGVKVQQAGEGWRKSRSNYPDKTFLRRSSDATAFTEWPQTGRDTRGRTLCQRRREEKVRRRGGGTTLKMHSLVLTGRNVRLVLLDVGAHSRVLDGGNLSECATVTTEPLHVKQPGLSLLSVCLSFSQSVLSVSACPRRCYNEMCDPSQSDSATLQGQMWKDKKKKDWLTKYWHVSC